MLYLQLYKLTLTVVEMQQLQDLEKTDSKEEISRLKWTIYNGRRKVCVNFQTDTDKLNILVYCYRNTLYLKDNEVILRMTEYQSLLAKGVSLLSYIDMFYQLCIVLEETTVIIKTNYVKNGRSFPYVHFPIVPGMKIVI